MTIALLIYTTFFLLSLFDESLRGACSFVADENCHPGSGIFQHLYVTWYKFIIVSLFYIAQRISLTDSFYLKNKPPCVCVNPRTVVLCGI